MCAARIVFFLLAVVGAASLTVDVANGERPVTKVVNLLKDMKAQVEKEGETDQALFDEFKCWCETYDKEKTKAIADAEQSITDLTATIEECTAKAAELTTDTEKQTKDVAEKTKAVEEATAIREKESSEFSNDEKDLSQSIGGLGGAVKALGAAHGEFAQESFLQAKQVLNRHLHKLLPEQESTVLSFLQQRQEPASGAIFGILKGMKESFESNLATSQKDESTAQSEFGSLKSAKNKEVDAANSQIDANEAELAENNVKLSNSKQSLEDTRAALAADTAFLADLKSKCSTMDEQWEARQKMRNDEITSIAETIKILTDDEAHDTFSRSVGFVQVRSLMRTENGLRKRVASFLRSQNMQLQSPRLALLAVSVMSDPFAKMKENIDKLVAGLEKTQQEEVEERDFCIDELNKNEDQTTDAKNKKDDLEQKIEDLKSAIDAAKEAIAAAKKEIFESQVAMKQAGINREKQNKEFQMTVADQRATQTILTKALDRLKQFYEKEGLFLQQAPPAPAGFGEYKKAGGATGALGLLEMIIKESKGTERKAQEDEQEAQGDYESFMKDSTASLNALSAEITDKTEELAKADGELTMAETDLKNTVTDIGNLAEYNNRLHQDCDYLMDNFKVRQTGRAAEIESLKEAKAIFSGARM